MQDCNPSRSGMSNSKKVSVVSGIMWSMLSRFGTLAITFGANIVLARRLSSEDFGVVGLLTVFVALAGTILDAGLGTALIQKKDPEKIDYSTVFVFNIAISSLLYATIFLAAPFIADYYDKAILTDILRVQSIILFVNAFRIIQYNILIKQLQFKRLTLVDIGSALTGSAIGVALAYTGFGVWSLVINNIAYSLVFTIVINLMATWRPSLQFSYKAFKQLFSFGGLVLVSNLIDTLYKNIQNLIVGKVFSISELGYYSQAKKLEEVPVMGVSSAINSVLFPVYSNLQDDKKVLSEKLNKNIDIITFVLPPIMAIVIIIAEPLVEMLYTAKWSDSIPYFQLLCVAGAILPVNMTNLNIIKSQGKGVVYLLMQIAQFVLGVGAMLIGSLWGVKGLICGSIIVSYLYTIIIININATLLGKSVYRQFILISKNLIVTIVVGLITFVIFSNVQMGIFLSLIIPAIAYVAIYLLVSYIFRMSGLNICLQIINKQK